MHSYLSKTKKLIYCSNCCSIPFLSIIPSSFPTIKIECQMFSKNFTDRRIPSTIIFKEY